MIESHSTFVDLAHAAELLNQSKANKHEQTLVYDGVKVSGFQKGSERREGVSRL